MIRKKTEPLKELPKCATGIQGLDEITNGGLPKGRPTLVCGGAGCGKTLFSMEFIVNGIQQFNEPGVFMAFEEIEEDLAKNVASLGFDLPDMIKRKKLVIDHVRVERSEIEETGEYDLEGLFVRLGAAIDSVRAKRVVLDTIESLFSGFSNENILRAELRRLFGWLKEKGVTAIITGESGQGMLTRHGLEEYVADCVITLDHRAMKQVSTRRMRIVKYRGSTHGTNEYPFLIDEMGFSVLPVTSLGLTHEASRERISSGIPRLDTMLSHKGFYRGSSILITGTAGTGKSSIAAHLAESTCRKGERCLYIATEESKDQILRNMSSIGLDLGKWVKKGLLEFLNIRPLSYGLEMHLVDIHKQVSRFEPSVLILDPISNLSSVADEADVKEMLTRLIDFLKLRKITSLYTNLVSNSSIFEATAIGISSLMDTWLQLRDIELNGERNRILYLLKSRGMAHSNQVREFLITDRGVELTDVYIGAAGVLTGSARAVQEAKDRADALIRQQDIRNRKIQLSQKKKVLESETEKLRLEYAAEERAYQQELLRDETLARERSVMALRRQTDATGKKAAPLKQRRKKR